MTKHSLLADLVDLNDQLQVDQGLEENTKRHRDREIGRELSHLREDPCAQVREWLCRVRGHVEESVGGQVAAAVRGIGWLITTTGVLLGWGCALAVFFYDGQHPVNVFNVLAVFVALQLLLVALFCVAALPYPIRGLHNIQSTLLALSPGHLQSVAARLLPGKYRHALSRWNEREEGYHQIYAPIRKWTVLLWSQDLAVAFNLSAVATALYLIVFSDLAFGWSTTLQTEPGGFYALTSMLALPWSHWFPDAMPSLSLIEATRFFRLQSGSFPNTAPEVSVDVLGGWWPFLVASMVCYGLFPRLVIWALAFRVLKRTTRDALTHAPGASQLRDRMNQELVETTGDEPESTPGSITALRRRANWTSGSEHALVVNWSGVSLDANAIAALVEQQLQLHVEEVLHAGGTQTLKQDADTIQRIADGNSQVELLVVVKAWEPPLLEFLDFISDLRVAVGKNRQILIAPVSISENGQPIVADGAEVEAWRSKVEATNDAFIELVGNRVQVQ